MATPAFGKQPVEIPGIGAILPGTEATVERHRSMERRKMSRPRQVGILRASKEQQVYIYNVGPFSRRMELGSTGVVVLPALPEKKVLDGLTVAGPVIREGFPAEPYPGEPRNQWIEHEPKDHLMWTDEDGEVFSLNERPGIDEALRIIGAHEQSPKPIYSASPYEQGCFVSTIPEQYEPNEPKEPDAKAPRGVIREYEKAMLHYEEMVRLYKKWVASVTAAQKRFIEWAARRGEDQCIAYAKGTYERDPEVFVLATILKKTERDWPFLAGSAENVVKKKCWNCKTVVDGDAATCPNCRELQIPKEEFEARRAKVVAA